jgi:virginiamycin B lyase
MTLIRYTDYRRGYLGEVESGTKVTNGHHPGKGRAGIGCNFDGAVWYSESGIEPNTIVRFDPGSRTFARWPIPSGGGVLRHIVAPPDGNLYIACSGVDKVGVVKVGR